MPTLPNYNAFAGLHWETGTVCNYLAYRGITAPHTDHPYSEALLMGISGGAVVGYFSFSYEGTDPQARLLTRNTFDPWDTMLSRLGVIQEIQQTSSSQKGVDNLKDALISGVPAIVWADLFTLPYNAEGPDPGMWAMMPILVYGYDETADRVDIADRAFVPLTCTPAQLDAARGRVKNNKYRLITLGPPNEEKLKTAVHAGIWDCIKLYTEKPPKGSKNNFGLAALLHWQKLLTQPKTRSSWAKEFPPGRKLYAALTHLYSDINQFGKNGRAERDLYAKFLDEAAEILEKPGLSKAAALFRSSGEAWHQMGQILLPDEVAILHETRQLMDQQHSLFLHEGNDSLERRRGINGRLQEIRVGTETDFPLSDTDVTALQHQIAAQVQRIYKIEAEAVAALKAGIQ